MALEALEQRVAELSSLPTLPTVVRQIGCMVEDDQATAAEVGALIAKDQVLSARILRLVNSSIYGFPGRISSVNHALVLLGFNVVKGLIMGTSVFGAFGEHAVGLWEHCLGCATLSRELAKELAMDDVEEVMTAGLLHDIGKAILSYLEPGEYARAREIAQVRNCHIAEAERLVFGTDHMAVAGWLGREWHMAERLMDTLKHHHSPLEAETNQDVVAVVHVADILARGMGYGEPGDPIMPAIDHQAFASLYLGVEQIDRALAQAEAAFAVGADIFAEGA